MPRHGTPFPVRFWAKVDRSGGREACWPWIAGRNKGGKGYGVCGYDSPTGDRMAHRVAWFLANGPIPDGMSVLHRCDNPPCCNPAHLFLGTYLDNARDRQAKGRGADNHREMPGEAHPRAKLTDDDVRAIRAEYAAGTPALDLARRFGVNRPTIYNVAHRRRWKHVV